MLKRRIEGMRPEEIRKEGMRAEEMRAAMMRAAAMRTEEMRPEEIRKEGMRTEEMRPEEIRKEGIRAGGMRTALALLIFGALSAASGAALWYCGEQFLLLNDPKIGMTAVGVGLVVLGGFSVIGGIAMTVVKLKQ
jgi:hypothetical protein